MRSGRNSRADAITNSPFVRALIKPMLITIPPKPILPILPPTLNDLIPTQPINTLPSSDRVIELESEVKLGKRKREEGTEEEKEIEKNENLNLIVEVNYTEENLPSELIKYWAQRYRLFSLYDEGCQMDMEGWYSVTPELVAVQIAERCRSNVIVDAFCGVGGNAIQFAFTCEKVIAIDISPVRLACARHNAKIYGVEDRITFILGDFVTWSKEYLIKQARGEVEKEDEVEVIFLSPPWGGIDYQDLGINNTPTVPDTPSTMISPTKKSQSTPSKKSSSSIIPVDSISKLSYTLSAITPIPGADLFTLARKLTPHIAYYLPRNTSMEEVSQLTTISPWIRKGEDGVSFIEPEVIEVEEEWMGRKMKAVTVYFGDLATKNEEKMDV